MFQSITNKMQRYTVVYFCKLFYMFRVVSPPIIRSTKLYLQRLVFVKPLLLPAAIAAGSIYDARTPERQRIVKVVKIVTKIK